MIGCFPARRDMKGRTWMRRKVAYYEDLPQDLSEKAWERGHIEPWELLRIAAWKSSRTPAFLSLEEPDRIISTTKTAGMASTLSPCNRRRSIERLGQRTTRLLRSHQIGYRTARWTQGRSGAQPVWPSRHSPTGSDGRPRHPEPRGLASCRRVGRTNTFPAASPSGGPLRRLLAVSGTSRRPTAEPVQGQDNP